MSDTIHQTAMIRPVIRAVRESDLAAVTRIYGHHVETGLASFEEQAPDESEMHRRMTALIDGGYPYVVAELDGAVVGYSYAGPYRARPGYRNSVENTVYLVPQAQGKGIAKALLQAVIDACTDRQFRQMVAIIGDSDNAASIGLHSSLGFELVGILRGIGFKHGRWVDSVLMQRNLGDGEKSLPAR